MNLNKYEESWEGKEKKSQYRVFEILRDQRWHCRGCELKAVGSDQIAGSGGIMGLKRGSTVRDGLDILSEYRQCKTCGKSVRHDRWTGRFIEAVPVGKFPNEFSKRALQLFNHTDVVQQSQRLPTQLTIDHKLPRIRWNAETQIVQENYAEMSDAFILKNFQLLQKEKGNDNLLKSRQCEACVKTGLRGKPFGINFFYDGSDIWAPEDSTDPSGCIGCGWYDFDRWRSELNSTLKAQLNSKLGVTDKS